MFAAFTAVAAHGRYTDADKASLFGALETLTVLVETPQGRLKLIPEPRSAPGRFPARTAATCWSPWLTALLAVATLMPALIGRG